MIPLRPVQSAEDVLERAREVQRRREAAYRAPPPAPKPKLVPPTVAPDEPAYPVTRYLSAIGPERPFRHYDILRVTTLNSEGIIRDVCDKYGVRRQDLKSSRHCRELVQARREAFFRLRRETALSYPTIGKLMGGKDHTAALYAYMAYLNEHPEAVLPSDERALASWRAKIEKARIRCAKDWQERKHRRKSAAKPSDAWRGQPL